MVCFSILGVQIPGTEEIVINRLHPFRCKMADSLASAIR